MTAYGASLGALGGFPRFDADALCAEVDPSIFFPEKGERSAPAKAICARCELRDPCLTYALNNNVGFGVWGGTTEQERRRLRGPRPTRVPGPINHGTVRGYRTHLRHGEPACRPCLDANRIARAPRP